MIACYVCVFIVATTSSHLWEHPREARESISPNVREGLGSFNLPSVQCTHVAQNELPQAAPKEQMYAGLEKIGREGFKLGMKRPQRYSAAQLLCGEDVLLLMETRAGKPSVSSLYAHARRKEVVLAISALKTLENNMVSIHLVTLRSVFVAPAAPFKLRRGVPATTRSSMFKARPTLNVKLHASQKGVEVGRTPQGWNRLSHLSECHCPPLLLLHILVRSSNICVLSAPYETPCAS